eukprot:41266-Eustigmatos_ZCMA.PRE.1
MAGGQRLVLLTPTVERALVNSPAEYTVEAVQGLQESAEHGDAGAQCELAACLYNGVGVDADKPRAAQWWELAAEQGLVRGQLHAAWCPFRGEG